MKKALTVLTLLLFLSIIGSAAELKTVIDALGARESTLTIFKQYDVTDDLTIPANITLHFLQGGSLNIGKYSIRNATYEWISSPAKVEEFYLRLVATGGDPGIIEPPKVYEDGTAMTKGVFEDLVVGEWRWGDNDGLGYNTVYVRIAASADPDGKAVDYVEAGYKVTINGHVEAGLYQIFEGTGSIIFGQGAIEKIYPQWLGAKGNGTDDDTVAIQSSIESFPSGGTVFFPVGTYLLTSELVITIDFLILRGSGYPSILKTNSVTNNLIRVEGTAVWPDDLHGVLISDLAFHGPNSGTGAAIYARRIHDCTFRNLYIGGKGGIGIGYGFYFDGSLADTDNNIIANNHIFEAVLNGIRLAEGVDCEDNTIIGNVISYTGETGIFCRGSNNAIIGNTIEESLESNIVIVGRCNTFSGNVVTESKQHGMRLVGVAAIGNMIIGNLFSDNDWDDTTTYNGIHVENADGNIIIGNRCRNNDKYEIYLDANSDNNVVIGNSVSGADHVDTIIDLGANNRIRDNDGFISENSGLSGAIATGANIAHGLDGTPAFVSVVAAEAGPTDIYVTAVGAVNFTVNFGGGGNKTFYWRASLAQSK